MYVPTASGSGGGGTAMFDILIFNLSVVSYLRMTPEKAIAKAEKKNKDLHLQACLERRRTFTPMVYSVDIIPRAEDSAAQKILAALLSYNLKREYSEMCAFSQGLRSSRLLDLNIACDILALTKPHI